MKTILRSLVIIACFICALSIFTTNLSQAKTNTNLEITSAKSDLINIVRVYEEGRFWLYFYTDAGIYITKMEEL